MDSWFIFFALLRGYRLTTQTHMSLLMWVWVGFEQTSLRIMFLITCLRFFLILTINILDYPDPLQYD